jgi:hypothetical protein
MFTVFFDHAKLVIQGDPVTTLLDLFLPHVKVADTLACLHESFLLFLGFRGKHSL